MISATQNLSEIRCLTREVISDKAIIIITGWKGVKGKRAQPHPCHRIRLHHNL